MTDKKPIEIADLIKTLENKPNPKNTKEVLVSEDGHLRKCHCELCEAIRVLLRKEESKYGK